MGDENTLLINLIMDLGKKVDLLPTRHEFDEINKKIDKFVLQSEFNTWKQYTEANRASALVEIEARFKQVEKTQSDFANFQEEMDKSKIHVPASWHNIAVAVISGCGGVGLTFLLHALHILN